MEKIQPGKFVELGYDLYEVSPNGEKLVHQTDDKDPEKIIFGVTPGMIVPLEKAIDGLAAGDTFDITVEAKDAFGLHDPEQIVELDKDIFEIDGKFDAEVIKKDAIVPMMTADGYRINGVVLDVTDDKVKMDFNHPLAGKDVRFAGKIITVRDATPEELQPQHGCGCGCHDDGCGDSCGCDDHNHCGDSSCGCGH
ncbi:MAG: FKBP-type peptidyl-prolyl cis-trans isomerase [Pseudoflavonifractor sp.]|nr:FKBP-type peptidyl-prolyl cis-trans isomerase [Pseudoflavonifractor sp.]